jgi:hypothetical protein
MKSNTKTSMVVMTFTAILGAVNAQVRELQPAVNLGASVNSAWREASPSLSADGLVLYFFSDRPGGFGAQDVWQANRSSVTEPFGEAVNLGASINSGINEVGPAISHDQVTLWFGRSGASEWGGSDLYIAERATTADGFASAVNVGPPINTQYWEAGPAISADGLSLYFHSDRPGGQGDQDIWCCTRASTEAPWDIPFNLGPEVNSPHYDAAPWVSPDGLTLLFSSNRPGGLGARDVYVCRRQIPSDPWGAAAWVPAANSGADEFAAEIGVDGLYYESDRAGGFGNGDIWVSPFAPRISITPEPSALRISWPFYGSDTFTLEQTELLSSSDWNSQDTVKSNVFRITPSESASFFRTRQLP